MISCMSTSFSPPPSSSNSAVPSARVVSFEEARHLVEQHALGVCPGEVETVELLGGLGRVLAEGILADRDFPAFARATRDGYALRAADVAEVRARLEVVGEVKAGDWPEPGVCSVGRGQAVGIMTGAPLPAGAGAGGVGGATSGEREGGGGAGGEDGGKRWGNEGRGGGGGEIVSRARGGCVGTRCHTLV